MKKCILCKQSLYQDISFQNIFKKGYNIHHQCEGLLNKNSIISFPFISILVHIHVLFPSDFHQADTIELFRKFGYFFFTKHDEQKETSIFILIDEKISDIDFLLIAKLCTQSLILFTYTNEDFLIPINN